VMALLIGAAAVIGGALPAISPRTARASIVVLLVAASTSGDAGRDAKLNRILGVLERAAGVLQAPGEATARRAGLLRYLAKSDDGIDALVAAAAVGDGSPAVVLTSDPDDLKRLLQNDRHVSVRVV
jgi:hypothetical protein